MKYIEIEVTDQYKTLATQLKVRNIDFYLKLTVARKFVVIQYYTIRLSRKKRSAWSGFAEHSIPYQHLMPNYNQTVLQLLGRRFLLTTTEQPMNTAMDTLPVTGVEVTVTRISNSTRTDGRASRKIC